MALTVSTGVTNHEGIKRVWRGTVTFDASYATGGEAFVPENYGFVTVDKVEVDPSVGYVPEYIASTDKILVRWVDTTTDGAPLAEVASTTDLSAVVFPVTIRGN
jgi:hypothetical protein